MSAEWRSETIQSCFKQAVTGLRISCLTQREDGSVAIGLDDYRRCFHYAYYQVVRHLLAVWRTESLKAEQPF